MRHTVQNGAISMADDGPGRRAQSQAGCPWGLGWAWAWARSPELVRGHRRRRRPLLPERDRGTPRLPCAFPGSVRSSSPGAASRLGVLLTARPQDP